MAGSRDEWAGLFAELANFCPRCGWSPTSGDCPLCRHPTDITSAGPTRFLGRWVDVRRGVRSRRGIVVGLSADSVEVLTEDRRLIDTRRDRTRLVDGAGPRAGARCGASEVLAAARAEDVPAGLHDDLVGHAVAFADRGGVRQQRGLILDALALADPVALIDRLDLTTSERRWWRVIALWQGGRLPGAVEAMLRLPDGRYPLRLALLWHAAAGGHVAGGDRERAVVVAQRLGEVSPTSEVAARLVVRALRDGPGDPGDREDTDDADLVAAASAAVDEAQAGSPWASAGRWLRGERGDTPRSRLVGALRSSPARLGSDPTVLDAAPPEVLDDLIDQAAVPEEWLDRAGELACGAYLLARTRIGMLDEDGLRRAGAVDELARRSARDGQGLPPDVPGDVRARYAALAQARSHDDANILALAEAFSVDAGAVRRAMADPAALPPAHVLAHPQLAEALVDRSALDTTALVPAELTDDQRRFAGQVLVRRAKAALHGWDLAGAEAAAVACLRFARDADDHDEALNLLAAVHWQRGDDGLAGAALDATRRQDDVDGLLVNAAVVAAAGTDRQAATGRLLRVAEAAASDGLRAQAALAAALAVEDPAAHPDVVRALRAVVRQPIPLDDFVTAVMLLSTFDRAWLSAPGALEGSPHAGSAPARVYVARAAGRLDDHLAALADALDVVDTADADADAGAPAPWALRLRDQMVDSVIGDLRTSTEPEQRATALALGSALLRAGLTLDVAGGVEVRALVVEAASVTAGATDAEPREEVVDWLAEAVERLADLPEHARSRLAAPVAVASSELCRVVVARRSRQLARFEDLLEDRWAMMGGALGASARLGVELCEETRRLLHRLRPLVARSNRDDIEALAERCGHLASRLGELTGKRE